VARRKSTLDAHVSTAQARHRSVGLFKRIWEQEAARREALAYIRQDFGSVDVLEYSPTPPTATYGGTASKATIAAVQEQRGCICSARCFACAGCCGHAREKVGPHDFHDGSAFRAAVGRGGARLAGETALRTYALSLYAELASQGVYVAHVSIGLDLAPGTAGDPDAVGRLYPAGRAPRSSGARARRAGAGRRPKPA